MKARASFQVRPGWQDDWQPAMDLAWKTFLRFEAADYLPEGIGILTILSRISLFSECLRMGNIHYLSPVWKIV